MQGSLGYVIWTACYLAVLLGLSAYGVHRYFIIYLFLKNRKRAVVPAGRFRQLPRVTVQLPIFNEIYVVQRLLRSVSELDYQRIVADPSPGRFDRRYAGSDCFVRRRIAAAWLRCSADSSS